MNRLASHPVRRLLALPLACALAVHVAAATPPPADPWDPQRTHTLRNPFHPPGYVPPADRTSPGDADGPPPVAHPPPDHDAWQRAEATLSIQGISRGAGQRAAVLINGRVYGEGDVLATAHGEHRFQWRVAAIDPRTGVRIERLAAIRRDDPDAPPHPPPETRP